MIASAPALPDDRLYPKERALVDLALAERAEGRRVLVYATHTQSRDITPRLERVLSDAGLRVATLKAETVSPERREEWVERRAREGVDVLITHPRLVQTGLDYEESGRQASPARRSRSCLPGRPSRDELSEGAHEAHPPLHE